MFNCLKNHGNCEKYTDIKEKIKSSENQTNVSFNN